MEICTAHGLLKHKETDKQVVNVYSVKDKKMTTLNLKSAPDAVALDHDGRYLIVSIGTTRPCIWHEEVLTGILQVNHSTPSISVRKQSKLSGVRQWMSNLREFCWTDGYDAFGK